MLASQCNIISISIGLQKLETKFVLTGYWGGMGPNRQRIQMINDKHIKPGLIMRKSQTN